MSSEHIVKFSGMAEGGVDEDVKAEVGDDTSVGDDSNHRVIQANGRPLAVGVFTGLVMSQMLHEVHWCRS